MSSRPLRPTGRLSKIAEYGAPPDAKVCRVQKGRTMSIEPLPPAVRIAFVPFCVASLSRSDIDRVFNANGVALPSDANPYSKKNLVDAYCKVFDWRNEEEVRRFRDIVGDVLSLAGGSEQAAQAA